VRFQFITLCRSASRLITASAFACFDKSRRISPAPVDAIALDPWACDTPMHHLRIPVKTEGEPRPFNKMES